MDVKQRQLASIEQEVVLRGLALTAAKPGCTFLEVGSWCGDSTLILGKVAQEHNGRLFCIDWWNGTPGTDLAEIAAREDIFSHFWRRVREANLQDVVVPIRGRSELVAQFLKVGSFQLIFLDADHRYESIVRDLRDYAPLVCRDGGICCGHDCEGRIADYDADFLEAGKDADYHESVHCGVVRAVGDAFPNCSLNHSIWSVRAVGIDGWQPTNLSFLDIPDRRQSPPAPIACTKTHNLLRYGRRIYVVPNCLGGFDVTDEQQRNQPGILTAGTRQQAEKLAKDAPLPAAPVLVEEGYLGFNIFAYQDRFDALAQSLGAIDLGRLLQADRENLQRQSLLFSADSHRAVRLKVTQGRFEAGRSPASAPQTTTTPGSSEAAPLPARSRTPLAFCYLKDQQPISQAAYERACKLREQVQTLISGREDFLRRSGRPPAIHLPHGNWELGGGLYNACRAVLEGDYSVINNLRLFSQIFTGYQLLSLSRGVGLSIPRSVPENLDQRLAARASSPGPEVDAYVERTAHLPEVLHISPPNVFGEIGWLIDGKIVNYDTNVYLERIALLAESGKFWELRNRTPERAALRKRAWERPRILEIGSGYGGLAHHLLKLIPQARYFLVDIPESLLFASIYLSTLWEDCANVLITPANLGELREDTPGFTFVPNFLFDDCCSAGMEFDLVINTLSMSEMNEKQVRYYCQGINRLLGRRGVFFEQNQDNRTLGWLDARALIANHFRFCLPLTSTILAPAQGAAHLWADVPVKPYAWGPSAAALRFGHGASPASAPVLVEEGYLGFNIVSYEGRYYCLAQDIGPIDLTRLAPSSRADLERQGRLLVADSHRAARLQVANARAAVR